MTHKELTEKCKEYQKIYHKTYHKKYIPVVRCPKCKHKAKMTRHGLQHYGTYKFSEMCLSRANAKDHHITERCRCVLPRSKMSRPVVVVKMSRIVCISGSRSFRNYPKMEDVMKNFRRAPIAIVSGCARGADVVGEYWAQQHNIPVVRFPADWSKYGKSAGAIRNKQMVEYADEFIVFWDGESPGTKIMIDLIKASGKHLVLIKYKNRGVKNGKTEENNNSNTEGISGSDPRTDSETVLQPGVQPEHKDDSSVSVDNRIADAPVDDSQAV